MVTVMTKFYFQKFSFKIFQINTIIFGVNKLDPNSGSYYNSLIIVDNNLKNNSELLQKKISSIWRIFTI